MGTQNRETWIWNPQRETMPREELNALQLQGLQATLARVEEKVPFYETAFRQAGVRARDIRSLDDVRRLPLTTKDDLRAHYPFGFFAVQEHEAVRIHASSGTMGKPTPVGYTRSDLGLWSEVMARIIAAGGVTADDVAQISFGYGLFTGGLGLHYGLERVGATVVPAAGGNTPRQLLLMQDFGTTVLVCTPSYALYLGDAIGARGLKDTLKLRTGLFGAEPWSESLRQRIEETLGIQAYDNYGLSEIIGPGVSGECVEKNGLHINEDHFYPEIIDPDTGKMLPEGEEGELVLTSLTKEAMPLIRYRTRDRTRLRRDPCPCGRTLVRMDRVLGRTDDMLIVRGVNVFPSQIEHVLLEVEGVEPHYQIILDRGETHLDELEVWVEVPTEVLGGDPHALERLERRVTYEMRSNLGLSVRIKMVPPNTVNRTQGKAKRVVDKREL